MLRTIKVSDINYGGRCITSNVILKSDGNIFWEPTLFLFQRSNSGVKASSISNYAQDLVTFLNVVETSSGNLNWKDVTDQQMSAYLHSYLQVNKKLKLNSLRRNIASLKTFYDWSWEMQLIGKPPTFTFGYDNYFPKGEPVSLATNYINEFDFFELSSSISTDNSFLLERDELVLAFGYFTGVRAQEIVDPRNFNAKLLRQKIYKAKDENKITLNVEIIGKGEKLRTLIIPPELFFSLESFLFGRRKSTEGTLICKEDGSSLNRQHASTVFSKAVRNTSEKVKSEMKSKSYHSLRHTFATNLVTWCYENNRDPWHIVPERMGHVNKETTLNYISWEAYLNNRIDVVKKLSLGERMKYKKDYG